MHLEDCNVKLLTSSYSVNMTMQKCTNVRMPVPHCVPAHLASGAGLDAAELDRLVARSADLKDLRVTAVEHVMLSCLCSAAADTVHPQIGLADISTMSPMPSDAIVWAFNCWLPAHRLATGRSIRQHAVRAMLELSRAKIRVRVDRGWHCELIRTEWFASQYADLPAVLRPGLSRRRS